MTLDRQVVQAFLYWCPEENSNIYAYPLPWVPLLDCQTNKVGWVWVQWINALDRLVAACTAADAEVRKKHAKMS